MFMVYIVIEAEGNTDSGTKWGYYNFYIGPFFSKQQGASYVSKIRRQWNDPDGEYFETELGDCILPYDARKAMTHEQFVEELLCNEDFMLTKEFDDYRKKHPMIFNFGDQP